MNFRSLLNYKNMFTIGLLLFVFHIFYELNKLKKQVKLLQALNSPKKLNLEDVEKKPLLVNNLTVQPNIDPKDLPIDYNYNNNPIKQLNIEPNIVNPIPDQNINIAELSELKENESEIIPIYSNDDNDEADISINITEKLENNIKTDTETIDEVDKVDKVDEVAEVDNIENDEKDDNEDSVSSNISSEKNSNLDKTDLNKMKKNDLIELANKNKVSIVKNTGGKIKHKTKNEIIQDLLST